MKKIIFSILLCAACLVACQDSNGDVSNIKKNGDTQSRIEYRLDSLDAAYTSKGASIKKHKPAENTPEEKKDTEELKKKQDNAEIAEKDKDGFNDGAAVGGMFGAAIGSVATVIGTGWGTIIGGALGGIGGAVVSSIIEAAKKEDNQKNISAEEIGLYIKLEKDIYAVDLRSPISIYKPDFNLFFDEQIIGANVGLYHNCIISSLYENNGKDMFDWSPEAIRDSTIKYVMDLVDAEDPQSVYNLLVESTQALGEVEDASTMNPYIDRYMSYSRELMQNEVKAYTEEFMEIVQQELSDEQEVLQINGTISTYYYSCCLWEPYMPTMYEGLYVCHDDHNTFVLETYGENYRYAMVTDESITFIGVPVIRNDKIESLFVFDDMRVLSTTSWNNYVYQQDSNQWIFEPTDDITFSIHGTEYVIRQGTYQFDRFDGGYVVFL